MLKKMTITKMLVSCFVLMLLISPRLVYAEGSAVCNGDTTKRTVLRDEGRHLVEILDVHAFSVS